MATPTKFDESGDSDDLQALFDSIATTSAAPEPAPVAREIDPAGDSDELQALFDSVATEISEPEPAAAPAAPGVAAGDGGEGGEGQGAVFNQLGQLARQLHDSLRGLGYDRLLEDTARQIPDAQQRLAYVAQMTEQAASRVLNATEIAMPLQNELLKQSQALNEGWEKMFANQLSVDEFKALAADTRAYFGSAPAKLKATNDQLLEIVMAQDFQDLTGQVIKRVVELAHNLEGQLVNVLIEAMPADMKAAAPEGLMNGPVISTEGRNDVVTTQTQVDDLLESLGF